MVYLGLHRWGQLSSSCKYMHCLCESCDAAIYNKNKQLLHLLNILPPIPYLLGVVDLFTTAGLSPRIPILHDADRSYKPSISTTALSGPLVYPQLEIPPTPGGTRESPHPHSAYPTKKYHDPKHPPTHNKSLHYSQPISTHLPIPSAVPPETTRHFVHPIPALVYLSVV